MKFGRHGISYLFLRLGIGCAFLWVGADMFRNPEAWTTMVSGIPYFGLSPEKTFQITRIVDSALGLLFILNYWPRLTAAAAAICLAYNVFIHQGITSLAARDVGLLGLSMAILFWPYRARRRRWWRRLWPKKRETFEFEE